MKTIVFDFGGTFDALDGEMVVLLSKLLQDNNVAIISSSSWKQVSKQINSLLNIDSKVLNNLYILPESGGSMYQSWGKYGWVATYQNKLSTKDIEHITEAFANAIAEVGFTQPNKIWGKQLENGESKVTFSALGQKAPLEAKKTWDVEGEKRRVLVDALRRLLSSYEVRVVGYTSIDISAKGINKKYGIDELMKKLHTSKDDVIYVDDANQKSDSVALEMGLECITVRDVEETKDWIRQTLPS
jgi:phosphomannomutase